MLLFDNVYCGSHCNCDHTLHQKDKEYPNNIYAYIMCTRKRKLHRILTKVFAIGMIMSRYTDNQGYVRIYDPHNPCSDKRGYVYEHRDKIAKKLQAEDPDHPALNAKRCLRPSWMVHHGDEDKSNNEDYNLELMRGNGKNGHKSHHFTVNNPHPEERDEFGRFV